MKRIAMFGICGKMGKAISRELVKEEDIELVAGLDRRSIGMDIGEILGIKKVDVSVTDSYEEIKKKNPDIIIDFTSADIAKESIIWAIENNIDIIVGTTGFQKDYLKRIEKMSAKSNSRVFIVPNFAIGAVIMMKLSEMIACYFDNCEIIEMHHDKKQDAPSGTSIATADIISKKIIFNNKRLKVNEKENIEGSRGGYYEGVNIHSVRLPGLVAHQSVIFGARGQTLLIKHDSIDRSSFYPGVIMAIRNIDRLSNFTYGLDKLVELK
jgi:4-hydroxy-tetrahydrodipicolinate reductase